MNGCQFSPECRVADRPRKVGSQASGAEMRSGAQNLTTCPDCGQDFCYAHYGTHRNTVHGGAQGGG